MRVALTPTIKASRLDNSEHPEADGCHYSTQHDQVAEEVQVEQGQYLSESSRRDHPAEEWR